MYCFDSERMGVGASREAGRGGLRVVDGKRTAVSRGLLMLSREEVTGAPSCRAARRDEINECQGKLGRDRTGGRAASLASRRNSA